MTSPSSSATIGGPCSSSVAVTNSVNPEMSASTRIPSSVWLFMPMRPRRGAGVKARGLRLRAVNREFHEVLIGVPEVDAGRGPPGAAAGAGARFDGDPVARQQRQDLLARPLPLEAEVGGTRRRPSRAEIARARRKVGAVDVDLLRLADADRRHPTVAAARARLPGDREAEALVEIQRALQVAGDDHPVVNALDAHGSLSRRRGSRARRPRA